MTLISDILMIAGALGAAFYCVVLSRRLNRFTDLEKGVGGAIAVLSAQVDDMTRTLKAAQAEAGASGRSLEELTQRAEDVARRLELNVAALHDIADAAPPPVCERDPDPAPEVAAADAPVPFRRPTARTEPEPRNVTHTTAAPPVRSFFASHRSATLEEAQ
ncbi:hypothetical protein [Oceaniglobus roseus]|uniref:hypothetical protein n=1 Tax=Oceaniglobus roseus TaxID=1737570 RepID=UPI001FE3C7FB|nr:hypothetical protein [Kandeliimicrobium roseum]